MNPWRPGKSMCNRVRGRASFMLPCNVPDRKRRNRGVALPEASRPAPAPVSGASRALPAGVMLGETAAQFHLLDFAGCAVGQRLDEDDVIRDPPLGDLAFEKRS